MLPIPGLRPHANESAPPMKIVGTKVLGGSRSQLHGGRASLGRLRHPIHGKSDRNRHGQYKENPAMMMLLLLPHHPPGHNRHGLLEALNKQMMPPSASGLVLSLTSVPPGLLRVPGHLSTRCHMDTSGGHPVTRTGETTKNTELFLRGVSVKVAVRRGSVPLTSS